MTRSGAACAWLALATASALARAPAYQTQAELLAAFDRVAGQYAAANASERPELAAQLSGTFLRLEDGAERDQRLALGAAATLDAGRVELALRLSAPGDGGWADPALVAVQLRALVREGRIVEWSRLDAGQRERWPSACDDALRTEEARLLPVAAAALRGPDRPAGRRAFERLAELRPEESYRLATLALCLRQIGDLQAASAVYERARERAPGDLQLWNDYGLLLRASGKRQVALEAFRRSVARDLGRDAATAAKGPAITNLVHMEALRAGSAGGAGSEGAGADPVALGSRALAQRPDATMLRRLMLDVQLDRLVAADSAANRAGSRTPDVALPRRR